MCCWFCFKWRFFHFPIWHCSDAAAQMIWQSNQTKHEIDQSLTRNPHIRFKLSAVRPFKPSVKLITASGHRGRRKNCNVTLTASCLKIPALNTSCGDKRSFKKPIWTVTQTNSGGQSQRSWNNKAIKSNGTQTIHSQDTNWRLQH